MVTELTHTLRFKVLCFQRLDLFWDRNTSSPVTATLAAGRKVSRVFWDTLHSGFRYHLYLEEAATPETGIKLIYTHHVPLAWMEIIWGRGGGRCPLGRFSCENRNQELILRETGKSKRCHHSSSQLPSSLSPTTISDSFTVSPWG